MFALSVFLAVHQFFKDKPLPDFREFYWLKRKTIQRAYNALQYQRSALTEVLACICLFSAFMPKLVLAFSCEVSATGVNFSNYDPIYPLPTTGAGNIHIVCSSTLADLVDLIISTETSLSPGNSGTYDQREMRNGSSTLIYNLYADPGFSDVWGDGITGDSVTVSRTGINLPLLGSVSVDIPVYGRIPAGQTNLVTGEYTDSITVTVTF